MANDLETPPLVEQLLPSRERFVGFVQRRVNDRELAEDIVQDSLLKALKAAPALRHDEQLLPWFYRVLRNAIVDEYRKRGVLRRYVSGGELPEVADVAHDDTGALCACFESLLPGMKPEYAELIRSLDLEQREPAVVASELGLSTNTLKVRRHRARQALRKQLEHTCGRCADEHCLDCAC